MIDEHQIAFGCRVRRIRTVLGLTHIELAARSGLTVGQIVAVEGGRCALTLNIVAALIRGLGCAPKVLLRTAALRRPMSPHDQTERKALFEVVSPEVQAAAIAILRYASKRRQPPAADR